VRLHIDSRRTARPMNEIQERASWSAISIDSGGTVALALLGFLVAPHLGEQLFKPLSAHVQGAHVAANDILTKIVVHLDDDGSRKPRSRHYEVITLLTGFRAAEELTDRS